MDDASLVLTRHKLSVEDYYRMADAGILGEDDRVELIEGELIDMAPIGQDHATIVDRLNEALVLACAKRAIVSAQNRLRLNRLNEPQPDFSVLRRRADFYGTGERAGPSDALLVVEVADGSLRFDRTVKLPLYAQSGVAEVWLVDVKRRSVETYRRPVGDRYSETSVHVRGEALALSAAPEIRVQVDEIFG